MTTEKSDREEVVAKDLRSAAWGLATCALGAGIVSFYAMPVRQLVLCAMVAGLAMFLFSVACYNHPGCLKLPMLCCTWTSVFAPDIMAWQRAQRWVPTVQYLVIMLLVHSVLTLLLRRPIDTLLHSHIDEHK